MKAKEWGADVILSWTGGERAHADRQCAVRRAVGKALDRAGDTDFAAEVRRRRAIWTVSEIPDRSIKSGRHR